MDTKAQLRKLSNGQLESKARYAAEQRTKALLNRNQALADKIGTLEARIREVQTERRAKAQAEGVVRRAGRVADLRMRRNG